MDTLNQPRIPRRSAVAVHSGVSWLGLVAATTKGIGELGRVRVRIKATSRIPGTGTTFRLVVQSYAASSLKHNEPPSGALVPISSLQRSVSQDQLRAGIELDIVHVGSPGATPEDTVVFAWVEPGHPDFKYDAALARPSVGALRGRVLSRQQWQDRRVAEVHLTAA